MKIQMHNTRDWCHLCGSRVVGVIDVWYPENAEHSVEGKDKYIRVCARCITKMLAVVMGVALERE